MRRIVPDRVRVDVVSCPFVPFDRGDLDEEAEAIAKLARRSVRENEPGASAVAILCSDLSEDEFLSRNHDEFSRARDLRHIMGPGTLLLRGSVDTMFNMRDDAKRFGAWNVAAMMSTHTQKSRDSLRSFRNDVIYLSRRLHRDVSARVAEGRPPGKPVSIVAIVPGERDMIDTSLGAVIAMLENEILSSCVRVVTLYAREEDVRVVRRVVADRLKVSSTIREADRNENRDMDGGTGWAEEAVQERKDDERERVVRQKVAEEGRAREEFVAMFRRAAQNRAE